MKFFRYLLPGIGWLFTLGAAGLQLFWEKAAADLATSKERGQPLSISGTVSSSIVSIAYFRVTQTDKKLWLLGEKIDHKFEEAWNKLRNPSDGEQQALLINSDSSQIEAPQEESDQGCSVKKALILLVGGASGLAISGLDTWNTSNTVYQEIKGLINEGVYSQFSPQQLNYICWATAIALGVYQATQDLSLKYTLLSELWFYLNKPCNHLKNISSLKAVEEGRTQYQAIFDKGKQPNNKFVPNDMQTLNEINYIAPIHHYT